MARGDVCHHVGAYENPRAPRRTPASAHPRASCAQPPSPRLCGRWQRLPRRRFANLISWVLRTGLREKLRSPMHRIALYPAPLVKSRRNRALEGPRREMWRARAPSRRLSGSAECAGWIGASCILRRTSTAPCMCACPYMRSPSKIRLFRARRLYGPDWAKCEPAGVASRPGFAPALTAGGRVHGQGHTAQRSMRAPAG